MLALLNPPTGDDYSPSNQPYQDPDLPFLWGQLWLAIGLGILGFLIVFHVGTKQKLHCLPADVKGWVDDPQCVIPPLS